MKIAYVTTQLPTPEFGYGQRTLSLLDSLSEVGDVDVIWMKHREASPAEIEHSSRIKLSHCPITRLPIAKRLPTVLAGTPPVWAHSIENCELLKGEYDLIWFSRLQTWILAGKPKGAHIAIDFDDLSDELYRTKRVLQRVALKQIPGWCYNYLNEILIRYNRKLAAKVVHGVFVCSDRDAVTVASDNCHVIPNGTNLNVQQTDQRYARHVVFVGPMRYPPNFDAASRIQKIAEALKESEHRGEFRLFGEGTQNFVDETSSVKGFGFVDLTSSIYDQAAVALIPLRAGAGTRLKVLEAMAFGVPIVATPFAVAGLKVINGETALLAEDNEALLTATERLLNDVDLRISLATRARAHVETVGSWQQARESAKSYVATLRGIR